jgi:hypothetical protein
MKKTKKIVKVCAPFLKASSKFTKGNPAFSDRSAWSLCLARAHSLELALLPLFPRLALVVVHLLVLLLLLIRLCSLPGLPRIHVLRFKFFLVIPVLLSFLLIAELLFLCIFYHLT